MIRYELIKLHKQQYKEFSKKAEEYTNPLSKEVAKRLTLSWIKGVKWAGGLPDWMREKKTQPLLKMGYTRDEIDVELDKQMQYVMDYLEQEEKQ